MVRLSQKRRAITGFSERHVCNVRIRLSREPYRYVHPLRAPSVTCALRPLHRNHWIICRRPEDSKRTGRTRSPGAALRVAKWSADRRQCGTNVAAHLYFTSPSPKRAWRVAVSLTARFAETRISGSLMRLFLVGGHSTVTAELGVARCALRSWPIKLASLIGRILRLRRINLLDQLHKRRLGYKI